MINPMQQQINPTDLYLQKVQEKQNNSLSMMMQSGDKYVYWKGGESAVNALAYGKNFGYNMYSTFRINPLLDLATGATGINSKLGKLASKVSFGNRNLTTGLNLWGNLGIRYVTPEAIKNNPADEHLMHGLNFTIGRGDLSAKQWIKAQMMKNEHTAKIAEKIFKESTKPPSQLLNKIISSPITKGFGRVASSSMATLNTAMVYEMAIEFAEMYNDHIINSNIRKALDYKKDSVKPLSNELLEEKTQHNFQIANENENELNFLLRSGNNPGRYF